VSVDWRSLVVCPLRSTRRGFLFAVETRRITPPTSASLRVAAALSAFLFSASLLSATPAFASSQPASAEGGGEIDWVDCPDNFMDLVIAEPHLYSCAVVEVPLDHDEPDGPTTEVELVRRATSDPESRVGTLVAGAGGPGSANVMHTALARAHFQGDVMDRFDIVGHNPRGARMDCFDSPEHEESLTARFNAAPVTPEEISDTAAAFVEYGEACARNEGDLLPHLSTAATAHDLDLIRELLGEEQLNFLGMSQSGLTGATYANLYPERVRALILDSPVDATRRNTTPLDYDLDRSQASESALTAMLDLCEDNAERCAFGEGDPREKLDTVRERLYEGPLSLPDGETVTLGTLVPELQLPFSLAPALAPPELFDGTYERL